MYDNWVKLLKLCSLLKFKFEKQLDAITLTSMTRPQMFILR